MSAPSHGHEVCVASLNIWNLNGPDFRREVALPQFLRECDPNIVLLQEVSLIPNGRPQSVDLARFLNLPVERYYFAGTWQGREEGLAILSKFPVVSEYRLSLPTGTDGMGRAICGLTLDSPFGSLDVFTTHLAFPIDAGADRERQARACRSFIHQINPDFRQRPIIFGGDFNDQPGSATVGLFLGDGVFVDSMAGIPAEARVTFALENPYTDPALHPGRCIDYVLHNSMLATVEARVAGAAVDARLVPSDHYAVLARLCPK